MHKEFGASPRDLVRYARTPDAYKSLLTREITSADDNSFFRHIILVGPSQDSRGYFEEKFASRPVFDLRWDISLKHRTDKMAHLYQILQVGLRITMTVGAGWIFESRVHQLLTRRKTIQLFPILGRRVGENLTYDDYAASGRQKRSMSLQLAESEQHLLPEGGALEEGRYYRPESADFPGIDSLLLVHPPGEQLSILFMFRITWDQDEHGVNADSLRKIDDLELPSNARRCYVIVTPEDVLPKVAVSMEQFWSERRRLLTDAFPVFYYPARRLFED